MRMFNTFFRYLTLSCIVLSTLILFAIPGNSYSQEVEEEDIPEVVLEAFSQGFYRPLLRYIPASWDSLRGYQQTNTAQGFEKRLLFALQWSGYVELKVGTVTDTAIVSDEILSGPPTNLRFSIFPEGGDTLRARISLAEPDEQPFYTGSIQVTPGGERSAGDVAAEEILRRLTGMTPSFRSRIVCVESQPGDIKELVLVAYDGDRRWQMTHDNSIALSPSWSPEGTKIIFSSFRGGEDSELYIADLKQRKISLLLQRPGTDAAPAWSPDGKWIVFAGSKGFSTDLYLIRPDGTGLRNLTASPSIDTSPEWSPTGREIVFMSDRSGNPQIYRMDIDGANLTRLTYDGSYNADPAWSPAGDRIVYVRRENKGFQVRIMDPSGDVDVPLTNEYGDHLEPSWSPDGMKIAYGYSDKIWVMNTDGSEKAPLLARGLMPNWSPLRD